MKYKITTLDGKGLIWNPQDLDLQVGEKFTITEVVNEEIEENDFIKVTAILTLKDSGITQRSTTHTFPFDTWSGMITGYDPVTKQPILDETKLNTILAQFNLKTV